MRWLIAALLIAGSSAFLYRRYRQLQQQLLPPPSPPAPAAAPASPTAPGMITVAELKDVKKNAHDPNPGVRWTAMEMLFTFKDPDSVKLLENAVASDPDPDVRVKAIKLLAKNPNAERIPALVRGLQDYDNNVKLESLRALADVGDASASQWVVGMIGDPDPDIKMQAFKTLEQMNERQKQQFHALADQLRSQYEDAIKRAQQREQEKSSE